MTFPVATESSDDAIYCPSCGYDLRGIDNSLKCPECGLPLDRARLHASAIPWTHRAEIGRVRAYVHTVELVIRKPTRAAGDVARPVSFADAQRFRRLTVLVAMIGPVLLFAFAVVLVILDRPITMSPTASTPVRIGWALELGLVPVILGALYAFLLAASGVASYFFHPRTLPIERQNRAVALSCYACAPMALTLPSMLSIFLGLAFVRGVGMNQPVVTAGVVAAASVAPLLQAVSMLNSPVRMLRRATHCGVARAFALAVSLPILWTLLAAVILIGIPVAYCYLALIVMSLIA